MAAATNINRLINNIDPGKDFQVRFPGGALTNGTHGAFLKENIITPLFNLAALSAGERGEVVGVGDKKGILKNRVDAAFRLNDLERQQVTRLKCSSTGADPRWEGLYLAHDAGVGPAKLFKSYVNIITPGSILDPASRDKTVTFPAALSASILDLATLTVIAMDSALDGIEFLGLVGTRYKFIFTTRIAGYTRIEVEFNRNTFEEVSSKNVGGKAFPAAFKLFSGNPYKNEYVYNNWAAALPGNDMDGLIKLLTLMKELGDTLQVVWLLVIIGLNPELSGNRDKIAICTNDTVVWLRSIVNQLSCVLTEGVVTTFYPVAGNEAQRIAAQVLIKTKLLNQLGENHESVINILRLFDAKLADPNTTFYENTILPQQRDDLHTILTCTIRYLRDESARIIAFARGIPPGDMEGYRDFISKHMMKTPFHVIASKPDITHMIVFKSFLPNAPKRIVFRPEQVYSAVRNGRPINLGGVLGDVPCPIAAADAALPTLFYPPTSGGGGLIENDAMFVQCLQNNYQNDGFFTYLMINHMPELIYIALSYETTVTGGQVPSDYDLLLLHSTSVHINECFGKIINDPVHGYYFEVYDNIFTNQTFLQKTDILVLELLSTIFASHDLAVNETRKATLYDICPYMNEISIIRPLFVSLIQGHASLQYLGTRITTRTAEILAIGDAHTQAIGFYQELFDTEVELNILNKREFTNTPLTKYIKSYFSMGSVTHKNKNSVKRLSVKERMFRNLANQRKKNAESLRRARIKHSRMRMQHSLPSFPPMPMQMAVGVGGKRTRKRGRSRLLRR